jgi:hypothetical protein
MIVTPCPLTNKKYFPRLAPVIMVGKGIQRGVLTSPSTRQRGLVTLADIAPTVLEYFNIPKDKRMVGQAMTVLPSENPVAELQGLDEWIAGRNQAVAPVAVLMAAWQVLATALALVLMRQRMGKAEKDFSPYGRFALLGAVAIPLAALLVSPFATWGVAFIIASAVALTCAVSLAAMRSSSATAALQRVAALAVLTLVVDALLGARLTAVSILGNSFATGTRFYGVGNEYAGYLIATALIAAGLTRIFEESKSWLPWVGLLALTFILGCARWGANFGGASTAAAACAMAMVKARSLQVRWQQMLMIIMMSHIGRSLTQVERGDLTALAHIAQRKLQMNWNIIRFTPLNFGMLLVIPVLAATLHCRRGALKTALARHRAFDACVVGGVVGCVVALVMNDSGMVMVGLMLGTLVPALVLVVCQRISGTD